MSLSKEDDEDDYMSDAILQQCQDTRPGLVSSRVARLNEKEQKHKLKNAKNAVKPKKVLEQEKREEGLKSAINSTNKGFALLAKMGYKPGMAIGKTGEGRSEPVPIKLKSGRGGLGRENELKRHAENQNKMRVIVAQKKQKVAEQNKNKFLHGMSDRFKNQRAEKDLYKSQKVCEELDSQMDVTKPDRLFYWPLSRLPVTKKKKTKTKASDSLGFDDQEEYNFHVQDDESSESDESEEELLDVDEGLDTTEKLQILTAYLRSTHLYCVWCGTRFDDADDLSRNCPGDTSEAHDE